MFFFQEKIWRLLLRASLTKDGLLLGLQKNFQAKVELPKHESGSWQWFSSSCKTALRHTVPKQLLFRDNTPDFISSQEWAPHSPDLNPLDCSIWELGHIARTCLRRKAWTVCKPQRSWHCCQRKMTWCRWSDSEKSNFAVEKAFSSSGKAEWRTYSADFC